MFVLIIFLFFIKEQWKNICRNVGLFCVVKIWGESFNLYEVDV